ncbi:BPSL0761 family protein [Pseudomonas syringae]|uniref:BPSL0761 family protein n=1 Tax=Pseudomonas syringae TaxID=317 RepID=UPI0032209B01
MPSERTRSVIQTEAFLRELSKSPLIPEEYRNEAKRLLRHYDLAPEKRIPCQVPQ